VTEDDKERRDRELIELLNELRVALPGVQVLFAFLLTVPFSQRFGSVSMIQKQVYFASVLSTAAASVLLIAPTAYHRIAFRTRDKERMVVTSNKLAVAGTVFLALAIILVIWLITDIVFGGSWPSLVTAVAALVYGYFWYVLPLRRRMQERGSSG